ncbi:DsbA family oxidoreductase [Fictibacillus phosphorivorans]|uniref:DsbA family oxidoreductase n=1 Tax=Fictibacillus phosphorivorans TaxID=1221500 RepID=UPI00203B18F8|nr:DsbA family protein [Fictibacillus phosphorivorans]MCM3718612.1 DsbA family protein [Fictibacillus phosphorivorans]MCM3776235.1 DsbA family protein [Fictibacillus phosphorivorans]
MTIQVKVYTDFVCPYCFLAEAPLLAATKDKDVTIEWMPFELRPYPEETLKPEEDYLQRAWQESVRPLAQKMGVEIILPDVSPQPHTHLAHEGLLYSKKHNKEKEYTHRVFASFFQEGKDIGQINVLREIAEEIGLDGESFEKALVAREFSEAREECLRQAFEEMQITAVPTMFVGERVLKGLHPQPNIERALRGAIRDEKMEFCEGDECE